MKIIITEEQYSRYMRRRYECMKEFVDKLTSGEEILPVPPGNFEWNTYEYILVAFVRRSCNKNETYFNGDVHNEIMDLFGDRLKQYYDYNR
jgi:hypothetical protein